MTETKIETNENTKALGTQLLYLKAIFVAVIAVAVMSVSTAWATVDTTPATAGSTSAAAKAADVVQGADGINFLVAGSRIEYANDGTGSYWTVGPDGSGCGMCGPMRSSVGAHAAGRDLFGSEHALDAVTVVPTPTGPQQGKSVVVGAESGAWPVAPSQLVTKVIDAGSGLIVDGARTNATVDVAAFDSESGAVLNRTTIQTNTDDATGNNPEARARWMIERALDGQSAGARVLVAIPGENTDKARLLVLEVKAVTAVPECVGDPAEWLASKVFCIDPATPTTIGAPTSKAAGAVTVIDTVGVAGTFRTAEASAGDAK